MNMLKCIVVDDEPLAIKLLQDHIGKVSFLTLEGTYSNPLEAIVSIKNKPVELVFLDIQMPQLSGIQFMEMLQNRSQVIITSAYQEYAMDGFEHNVTDYLLKPISFERFYRAVEKSYNLHHPTAKIQRDHEAFSATGGYIFVKVETRMVRVELDDILFVEGLKNYVSIYTKNQRIVTLQSLRQLEDTLPSNRFVRVHKSYLIALDKISSIERQEINIQDRIIPIGVTYSDCFFKMLDRKK